MVAAFIDCRFILSQVLLLFYASLFILAGCLCSVCNMDATIKLEMLADYYCTEYTCIGLWRHQDIRDQLELWKFSTVFSISG